ncbi:hypothetical protein ES708_15860 [subsurface metagenome]
MQSPHTAGAASPDEVHQYRLYVVVSGMPRRHPPGADGPGCLCQEAVSYLTGGFFQRQALSGLVALHIPFLDSGWNTELSGQLGNIVGIGVGISAPELVVEVSYVQL